MEQQAKPTPIDMFRVSEIELIYRNHSPTTERPNISCSLDAYEILRQHWDYNKIELQEEFKIMLLNRSNLCLGIVEIGVGGTSSCIVEPKLVMAAAIKANATSIVLAHNHPSGNLKESEADILLTEKLVGCAKLFNMQIADHIIITARSYASFADKGIIPV